METSPLFARTFDFLSWLLPRTQSFPRPQRFGVTQRLQNAALDFQELIVEADTARGAARPISARCPDDRRNGTLVGRLDQNRRRMTW